MARRYKRTPEQLKAHRERERRRMASKPAEWYVWRGMKERCHYSGHRFYFNYGAKGVSVCDRWREHGKGFHNFLEDMGPRPDPLHDLDRIDPEKGYCPENCRWLHRSLNRARVGADVIEEPQQPPKRDTSIDDLDVDIYDSLEDVI